MPREHYEKGIVMDRMKREQVMQELSHHEAHADDVPIAKLLLEELHHTRPSSEAQRAIDYASGHMSPKMRAEAAKLMKGPFDGMWDKEGRVPVAYKSAPHAKNHEHSSRPMRKPKKD